MLYMVEELKRNKYTASIPLIGCVRTISYNGQIKCQIRPRPCPHISKSHAFIEYLSGARMCRNSPAERRRRPHSTAGRTDSPSRWAPGSAWPSYAPGRLRKYESVTGIRCQLCAVRVRVRACAQTRTPRPNYRNCPPERGRRAALLCRRPPSVRRRHRVWRSSLHRHAAGRTRRRTLATMIP